MVLRGVSSSGSQCGKARRQIRAACLRSLWDITRGIKQPEKLYFGLRELGAQGRLVPGSLYKHKDEQSNKVVARSSSA
jgi:hypothetical protein